jgi:hypothetical protein
VAQNLSSNMLVNIGETVAHENATKTPTTFVTVGGELHKKNTQI